MIYISNNWGLSKEVRYEHFFIPKDEDELIAYIKSNSKNLKNIKYTIRGLGRSYNNVSQLSNSGTILIDTTNVSGIIFFKDDILTVYSGTSLKDIINYLVPRNYFLYVVPGTKNVTVGGMVAANIHGKNNHLMGTFGDYIESIVLLTPDGKLNTLKAEDELFKLTIGGLGSTGFILRVSFKVRKISSYKFDLFRVKTNNLQETIDVLKKYDSQYEYSVAWINGTSPKKKLGRGIVDFANHSSETSTQIYKPQKSIYLGKRLRGFINKYTIKVFNTFWYYRNIKRISESIIDGDKFLFPLDKLDHWNYLYSSNGFTQFQYVVPFESEEYIYKSLELLINIKSFMIVLKRFGSNKNTGYLSFTKPGWTLAIDIPLSYQKKKEFQSIMNKLIEMCIEYKGRVYLVKDLYTSGDDLSKMYGDGYKHFIEYYKDNDHIVSDVLNILLKR